MRLRSFVRSFVLSLSFPSSSSPPRPSGALPCPPFKPRRHIVVAQKNIQQQSNAEHHLVSARAAMAVASDSDQGGSGDSGAECGAESGANTGEGSGGSGAGSGIKSALLSTVMASGPPLKRRRDNKVARDSNMATQFATLCEEAGTDASAYKMMEV